MFGFISDAYHAVSSKAQDLGKKVSAGVSDLGKKIHKGAKQLGKKVKDERITMG